MTPQHGYSLISLLVGLVISLIATVGLLSIYRNSLQVTSAASTDAVSDNQLTSLLLRTGTSLEDAGFGITSAAYGSAIVGISNASLTAGTLSGSATAAGVSGNAVVWSMLTGASTQCAGFYAPTASPFGLTYLAPVNCTSAAQWNALNWSSTTAASQSAAPITFTVAQQSCAPYGISANVGDYTVTLATTNSIGAAVSSLLCLINIQ